MAKVSVFLLLVSTIILLVTFGQGMNVLHSADVATHLRWSMATLMAVLIGNFFAMVHALQSARLIRELRAELEGRQGGAASEAPAAVD